MVLNGKRAFGLALAALLLTLAACSQYRERNRIGNTAPVLADVEPLYQACLRRCEQPGDLGSFTRIGCEQTCNDLRRNFAYLDRGFPNYEACARAMDNLDLNRDLRIRSRQARCAEDFTHLHDQKGCEDAVAVFYAAATLENVCGGAFTPQPVFGAQPATPPPAKIQPLPESFIRDTPKYGPQPERRKPAAKAPAKTTAPTKPALPAPAAGSQKDAPYPPEAPKGAPASDSAPSLETKDAPMPEAQGTPQAEEPAKAAARAEPCPPDADYEPAPASAQASGPSGQSPMVVLPGNSIITGRAQPVFADVPPASPDRNMTPNLKRLEGSR